MPRRFCLSQRRAAFELLDDVLEGCINPGRGFDYSTHLDGIVEAYTAMDERCASSRSCESQPHIDAWISGSQGVRRIPVLSGRAVARFPALARFAPRLLVPDLADQVSTHLREGIIEVALMGGGHEVRPSA
jgi:hypothetical protein